MACVAFLFAGAHALPVGGQVPHPLLSTPLRTCDIYDAAATPCVAAFSTVRALYASYDGPLYLVRRRSDNATTTVGVATRGGIADSAAQDAFCAAPCIIESIFDQSAFGNHIATAPGGQNNGSHDVGVDAGRAPLTMANGKRAFGAYFERGMGYRREETTGVATGDAPQSMYMVVDGKHYNNRCCFDFGNAETDARDHGKSTMEAIYWGNYGNSSAKQGPWVMADLEDGLWAGKDGDGWHGPGTPQPISAGFVTAMVKGRPGGFAIRGGDAQDASALKLLYEGPRPPGYATMSKQGAIILGVGGDNSNRAVGTFYEGAIVAGYASNATDRAVHADIVAAGYQRLDERPARR